MTTAAIAAQAVTVTIVATQGISSVLDTTAASSINMTAARADAWV
jgi:hypothetical protein